jgi:hypothetical protein
VIKSLVALDPGVKIAGVAVFHFSQLHWAGLKKGATWHSTAQKISECAWFSELVCEVPQVYEKRKTDPADLIALALVVGAVSAHFREAPTLYLPREWKGQAPKAVTRRRVIETLSADERKNIEKVPAGQAEHVYDAIGIGLFHLKKLGLRK